MQNTSTIFDQKQRYHKFTKILALPVIAVRCTQKRFDYIMDAQNEDNLCTILRRIKSVYPNMEQVPNVHKLSSKSKEAVLVNYPVEKLKYKDIGIQCYRVSGTVDFLRIANILLEPQHSKALVVAIPHSWELPASAQCVNTGKYEEHKSDIKEKPLIHSEQEYNALLQSKVNWESKCVKYEQKVIALESKMKEMRIKIDTYKRNNEDGDHDENMNADMMQSQHNECQGIQEPNEDPPAHDVNVVPSHNQSQSVLAEQVAHEEEQSGNVILRVVGVDEVAHEIIDTDEEVDTDEEDDWDWADCEADTFEEVLANVIKHEEDRCIAEFI